MIVSHRHRFIFIKTRKTAGTSIEISLSRYCAPTDIISPVSLDDEPLRGQFGKCPANYIANSLEHSWQRRSVGGALLWRACSKIELRRSGVFPHRVRKRLANWRSARVIAAKGGYYNHMPATEIRQLVGDHIWDSYYKFCVERDPVDKTISHYCYLRRYESFDAYLESGNHCSDISKYMIDGNLAVDKVIDFSDLKSGIARVCSTIGIDYDGWLPRAKSGIRPKSFHASQLTDDQIDRINEIFWKERGILEQPSAR